MGLRRLELPTSRLSGVRSNRLSYKPLGASSFDCIFMLITFRCIILFKVAATYSVSGAVVGEWVASQAGIGYYLLRVKNSYALDKMFASVLVIILLSLMMNGLIWYMPSSWLSRTMGS